MADDEQQILDETLERLKSGDRARQMEGILALETLDYSSKLIFFELERVAIDGAPEVREAALNALNSQPSLFVARQLSQLSESDRLTVLKEIETWEQNALIEPQRANVLRRRYDFEVHARPSPKPAAEFIPEEVPVMPAKIVEARPRPSLMQTLLSEASIRIYLYLGAFFVIASALILAAIVEAARLSILAVATLAFGGVALGIHKRLPQPSFAFFIVFSFLLPIDANELQESVNFVEPFLSGYWKVVFFVMAVIWSFSVWFYSSRFFSAVAFVALSLVFYRAGAIFRTEPELQIFLLMVASLVGLAATFLLRKWKDAKFSVWVFLLAQLQVLGLLSISLVLAIIHAFDTDISNGWWLLIALTWLTATVFYAWSNFYMPSFFFPWMAVGALLPLPWFLLNPFHPTLPIYALGFVVWGAAFGVVSEIAVRPVSERMKNYHWAFLAGSAPLFLTAFTLALAWDKPVLIFEVFALAGVVYAGLHAVHRRWYVWSAALVNALAAYFTFFYLPAMQRLEIPLVSQLTIGSLFLVVPELFTRTPLSLRTESRWPTLTLGVLVSLPAISLALTDQEQTGRGALILIIYAVLVTLHALHSQRIWLGYLAAALESLALIYALDHFKLDLWLPTLTLLAVVYYATGFFLRRMEALKRWGNMLINSSLVLGAVLSLTSLVLFKEHSGWYILGIALLFLVEIFARPLTRLEVAVEVLLSISLYLILDDFHISHIVHFLFGASLIWLGGDLIFSRLLQGQQKHRENTLFPGYFFLFLSTAALWQILDPVLPINDLWGTPNPLFPVAYFSLYAIFFVLYAFVRKDARLGYLAATYLALVIFKFCGLVNYEKWIFPLIALAVLYYASGYWLRQNQKAQGWDAMLRFSGLGLGVVTSMGAPLQGGLSSSIPVAITATLFAAEAFALHNVWWALPANAFYLMSYFMILSELNVEQPQYYSIGAALLGMLMHFLLTRAGSKTGAFLAGMLSQLVLLGTTYIQMVSTEELSFFFILFVQSMLVLIYGLMQRSRSLVITPIVFAVLGVMTVIYTALKGLGPVILIGSTGVVLLTAGIIAVLLRERITRLGEQLSEWEP